MSEYNISESELSQAVEGIDGMERYGVSIHVTDYEIAKVRCSVSRQDRSHTDTSVTFFLREDGWNTPRPDEWNVVEKAKERLNKLL